MIGYREQGVAEPHPIVYEGEIWPVRGDADKEMLTSLGVDLLKQTGPTSFRVRVTAAALERLDPKWGRFAWSLAPAQSNGAEQP